MRRYQKGGRVIVIPLVQLAVCATLALCLTSCSVSVPLGERAIVKAVYLDEQDGNIHAVLAVQTCQPSANAADAKSEINLYEGKGISIATAIQHAEQQQNKKPFYAQNRLLFLGEGAIKNSVSRYLSYFGAEEVSRTNLFVFVLPITADALCKKADSIETLIAESERMTNETSTGGNSTTGIYEAHFSNDGKFMGYLPVLHLDEKEGTPAQVQANELMLFGFDQPLGTIKNTQLQLALLFSGKGNRLLSYLSIEGIETVLKTQQLTLTRTMTGREKDRCMQMTLHGKIDAVSQNGVLLQGEALKSALRQYNAYVQSACEALYKQGFYQGIDLFNDAWWFLQDDTQATYRKQQEGTFYLPKRITFSVKIRQA